MGCEGEEERLARWERWALEDAAKHRRRMRAWKHAREYVSMKRLLVNGLVSGQQGCPRDSDTPEIRTAPWVDGDFAEIWYIDGAPVTFEPGKVPSPAIPNHPPWSSPSNWWPRYRWSRQG